METVSKKGTAYLVAAAEYESLLETVHLLRPPANAERLRTSIAAARGGHVRQHSLADVSELPST